MCFGELCLNGMILEAKVYFSGGHRGTSPVSFFTCSYILRTYLLFQCLPWHSWWNPKQPSPGPVSGICDLIAVPLLVEACETVHLGSFQVEAPMSFTPLFFGGCTCLLETHTHSGTTSGMWGRLTLPSQILSRVAFPMEISPLIRLCALSSEMYLGASVFTMASQWNMLGPFIKT